MSAVAGLLLVVASLLSACTTTERNVDQIDHCHRVACVPVPSSPDYCVLEERCQ